MINTLHMRKAQCTLAACTQGTNTRLTNPPGIPGLPQDLTYDPGISWKIQGFAKVCFGWDTYEFVNYEVNNY